MPYLIHTAHWHIDALFFCVLKPFSTRSIAPAGTRFRDLVVKVPNPRYVWFAWNLADRNNYMQWLFAKARRKKALPIFPPVKFHTARRLKVRERLQE